MNIRRHGDIEDFNGLVGEQFLDGRKTARDAARFRHSLGTSWIARGDGHGIEAGLPVGHEMAVAHDETGADAADADIEAARQRG